MTDLAAWLLAQIAADERIARAVSEHDAAEHWHWVETEHDEVLTLDPAEEFVGGLWSRVALRSVEEYPMQNLPGAQLPTFVIEGEEVRTQVGAHLAMFDPARIVAECEAKRQIIALMAIDSYPADVLRALALPYLGRPGYYEVQQ